MIALRGFRVVDSGYPSWYPEFIDPLAVAAAFAVRRRPAAQPSHQRKIMDRLLTPSKSVQLEQEYERIRREGEPPPNSPSYFSSEVINSGNSRDPDISPMVSGGFSEFTKCLSSSELTAIILATVPNGLKHYRRRLFDLCRQLKAIDEKVNPADLRPIVEQWHGKSLPFIDGKTINEVWKDFLGGWDKVKYLGGDGIVDAAWRRAGSCGPPPVAVRAFPGDDDMQKLASLCRELQFAAGEEWFFLDCRTAGRMLGTSHVTAWKMLGILVTVRILKAGKVGSKAEGKASQFKYIGGEQ